MGFVLAIGTSWITPKQAGNLLDWSGTFAGLSSYRLTPGYEELPERVGVTACQRQPTPLLSKGHTALAGRWRSRRSTV